MKLRIWSHLLKVYEKLLFCAMRVINFKKIADVSFLTQGFFYQNEDVVLKNWKR